MKRLLVLLGIVFLLVQCSDANSGADRQDTAPGSVSQKDSAFQSVSIQAGKMLIENKKNMVLLDVRTPEEVQQYGTIEGGSLVPFWAIMQNKLNVAPDTPIMVFCAVGGRSYFAGQVLAKNGYKEIYNLSGGIDAWIRAGYPVVR